MAGSGPALSPDAGARRVARRHDEALEQAATARKEIGPPEHVNAAYARDLIRRARERGFIDQTQRPIPFGANPEVPKAPVDRPGKGARRLTDTRDSALTVNHRRLRQAERGMQRELAELRELRTAPDLERNDPRRGAYEERFSILAAKGVRRAGSDASSPRCAHSSSGGSTSLTDVRDAEYAGGRSGSRSSVSFG